jgi:nucleotide-binding universal stress UspA family protein
VKLIVACDGRETVSYFESLRVVAPVTDADIIFVHVTDTAAANAWEKNAEHHWLGRHPGPRESERFDHAAVLAAVDILDDALRAAATWPAAGCRAVVQTGNPEREIVRLALSEGTDLVVVGQHRIELGPHALGHCARFVLDHAPCSVLLVRGSDIRASAPGLLGNRLKPRRPPEHR